MYPLVLFKDKNGKPIRKTKVKFKLNGKAYIKTTNKKGIATFNLKTPKKLGTYKVVSSYKKAKITLVYSQYYA